ncbi:unnamed protein product, partial [Brassica rapa subsp. trilocularis]
MKPSQNSSAYVYESWRRTESNRFFTRLLNGQKRMACERSFIVKTRSPSTLLGVTSQIIGKQKLATCLSKVVLFLPELV